VLSSFFSKSKPINFLVVGMYMLVLYSIAYLKKGFNMDFSTVFLFFGGFVAYVLTKLFLNLKVQKNDLTQKSTNTILLFAFLSTLLPDALTNPNILLSNLFIVLGVRCLMNLRHGNSIKSNILDASLFIGIASLAFFWSIGFMMLVFLGIFYFAPKDYRNWLIPMIGLLIIYVLYNCFTLLWYDSFFIIQDYVEPISFSLEYSDAGNLFSIGVLGIYALFFVTVYILKFKRKPAKSKPILRLIIVQLLIGLMMILIVPNKNTSEIIFVTSPLAIIGTTYIEMGNNKIVQEVNLWVFLLLPCILLFF